MVGEDIAAKGNVQMLAIKEMSRYSMVSFAIAAVLSLLLQSSKKLTVLAFVQPSTPTTPRMLRQTTYHSPLSSTRNTQSNREICLAALPEPKEVATNLAAIAIGASILSWLISDPVQQVVNRDAFDKGYRVITFSHTCEQPVTEEYFTDCKCLYSRFQSVQLCKVDELARKEAIEKSLQ